MKKTRQNKSLEPPFRFNRNGKGSRGPKALVARLGADGGVCFRAAIGGIADERATGGGLLMPLTEQEEHQHLDDESHQGRSEAHLLWSLRCDGAEGGRAFARVMTSGD